MLENIKFSYKVADEQKDLFSSQHVLYKCKIQYNGKSYSFPYQCNRKRKPELKDVLDCLFLDASCANYTLDEFAEEFGYGKPSIAIKLYKACIRTQNTLIRLFGDNYSELQDEIEQGL